MLLTFAAVLLLAATAGGGWIMARKLRRGVLPPAHLALGHGLLAMPSLAVSAFAAHRLDSSLANAAAVILTAAAFGGFVLLLGFHARNRVPPYAIAIVHGATATAGILCLLAAALIRG